MKGGCGCGSVASGAAGGGGTAGANSLQSLPIHNYYGLSSDSRLAGGGKKKMKGGNAWLSAMQPAFWSDTQNQNAPYDQPIQNKFGDHNQAIA